jgi:Eukaryotic-type DNA primase, large subunit
VGLEGLNLKKYPYLVDPWSYASLKLGFERAFETIAGDEHLLSLALKRINLAVEGKLPDEISASTEEEVFSFWLSLLSLKASGSIYLLNRVVDVEVERAKRFLEDEDDLVGIARSLGVRVESKSISFPWVVEKGRVTYRVLDIAVPVGDFLRYASGSKLEELRLVNNFVKGGYVFLERRRFIKLLVEASRRFILDSLKAVEAPETPAFEKLVKEVRELEVRESSGLREEFLPECIRQIISRSLARRLSDEEVYVLLSFLSAIGAPGEYVSRLLSTIGLAGEDRAVVVAESLARIKGYTPFKCEELKARGICDCEEDLVKEYMSRVRRRRARRRV